MCLIILGWQLHPDYPLAVAANRDEFHARPTSAATFWPDAEHVCAGRDLEAGGTWFGASRTGRFAALTNYREGRSNDSSRPSRGALAAGFLVSAESIDQFVESIHTHADEYAGFNLLLGDGQRLACYSNRQAGFRWLEPGVYGLSNHLLDTPWPKLTAAKQAFTRAIERLPDLNACLDASFSLLADTEIVPDAHLPETGVPLGWERVLSAVFVDAPEYGYGTRASTVLLTGSDGRVTFVERSFMAGGLFCGEQKFSWQNGNQSSLIST